MRKWLVAILFCVPLTAYTPTQMLDFQVQRLAAARISTFPAYVSWPPVVFAGHPTKLYIGFIGEDPLGSAGRQYLVGRGWGGKQYVLERLQPGAYSRDDLKRYQILIFGDLTEKELKDLLKLVAKEPVLTIGETPGFIENGGIIELHIDGMAVTWTVSMAHAHRADLVIDQRLVTYGKSM